MIYSIRYLYLYLYLHGVPALLNGPPFLATVPGHRSWSMRDGVSGIIVIIHHRPVSAISLSQVQPVCLGWVCTGQLGYSVILRIVNSSLVAVVPIESEAFILVDLGVLCRWKES